MDVYDVIELGGKLEERGHGVPQELLDSLGVVRFAAAGDFTYCFATLVSRDDSVRRIAIGVAKRNARDPWSDEIGRTVAARNMLLNGVVLEIDR